MSFQKFPPGPRLCGVRRSVALGVLMYFPGVARCQSPRAANPERPTFATHAYVVAPGYVELEQGVRVQGAGDLSDATAWDYNLKIGLARRVQLAFFGTAFMRTAAGVGPGDLGTTLKLSTGVSTRTTVALAASVTFPTGDASAGRGAGGTQGAVLAVASVDTPWRIHLDLNLGPVGRPRRRDRPPRPVGGGGRGRECGAVAGHSRPRVRGSHHEYRACFPISITGQGGGAAPVSRHRRSGVRRDRRTG